MSKRAASNSPDERGKRRRDNEIPENASRISEDDYFLKMNEFQLWLKDEKGRYFDELSGSKARHYFRKFVKYWNSGDLPTSYYRGVEAPVTRTSYKWAFAGQKTIPVSSHELSGSGRRLSGKVLGPTIPSESERQLAKEQEQEFAAMQRQSAKQRDRREQRDRIEDQFGPKEVGREGQLEKKRAQRESNRAAADAKDDGGLEFNDRDLMGEGDSFKAMIARRDANRKRFEEKKRHDRDVQAASSAERVLIMREKDKATMDMFKALAKERYG